MATNALLRTPSCLCRTKTCLNVSVSLLPRCWIATKRYPSTLPPQQPRRSNGQFLAGFAVATSLSAALWRYFRSPKNQTVQKTEQDPNLVDQVHEQELGEAMQAIEAFCGLAGLGLNSGLRMLPDFCQPILFLGNAQGDEMTLHTKLYRFERMDLPADRPSLVALWWQIPPIGNGDPDQIVPILTEILKYYEEKGDFEIPGYAVAMTQWRSNLIIWEYKSGHLEEVRKNLRIEQERMAYEYHGGSLTG